SQLVVDLDQEDAPALLRQLRFRRSLVNGHDVLNLAARLRNEMNASETSLVEDGLNRLDAVGLVLGGVGEGLALVGRQGSAEQFERVGDARGLGGERLQLDFLDDGEGVALGGRRGADEQEGGECEAI